MKFVALWPESSSVKAVKFSYKSYYVYGDKFFIRECFSVFIGATCT